MEQFVRCCLLSMRETNDLMTIVIIINQNIDLNICKRRGDKTFGKRFDARKKTLF